MTAETLAAVLAREINDRAIVRLQSLHDYAGRPTWDKVLAEEISAALSRAMSDDLAERVGEWQTRLAISSVVDELHGDAADLITALLAQNAALRAERDALIHDLERIKDSETYHLNRAERLEAELKSVLDREAAAYARHDAALAKAEAERDAAVEAKLDAVSSLDAWFNRRELGHEAVDQAIVDAASGYLRTSRVGGMPQEESDLILGVIQDMARLGLFADLFARAHLGAKK